MDILDILLDILLKPPQPFIGLFFFPAFKQMFFLLKLYRILSYDYNPPLPPTPYL